MTFSARLKEERKRLKLTQPIFAERCGVTKKSQVAYEGNDLPLFADYMEKAAAIGADVGYIVSGQRGPVPLTPEETALLALYRAAPPALRKAAMTVLGSAAAAPAQGAKTVTVGRDNTGIINL